jgi:hypothetical protein
MKKFISFFLSLAFAGSTFAQMSGYSSSQSDGTTLGANETLTADGIALGNAVKLRGYVNTILHRNDESGAGNMASDGTFVNGDIDFLINLSPITSEVHLSAGDNLDWQGNKTSGSGISLEQAFGRYSFNQDFHLTFGRQVTVLGFDSDEWTNRYAVTTAYSGGDANINKGRGYVDGMRLNYNNGMFGFVIGLHDSYNIHQDSNDLDDGIAIDIAASVMFIPGLEARLGFANENGQGANADDSNRINAWIAWQPSDLTLALEFDHIDLAQNLDGWDLMLLANYQFSDFFGATLRYSHMDFDNGGVDEESDKITLALLFSLTENFDLNLEYSHIDNDGGNDENQFYLQALLSY